MERGRIQRRAAADLNRLSVAAVLYNDTPSSPADPLIGYWDYGSSITLQIGETFTTDFGSSILTVS